ncbi:unnamed protein product [Cochlearia groenlandica]
MGLSCSTRNAYTILPLLIILFFAPSTFSFSLTDMVTKDVINKLCEQPTILNPRFCATWLTADPRATSMTIHGLLGLVVDKTRTFGLKNQRMLSDFAKDSLNDKQHKDAYESCVESYGIVIGALEGVKEFIKNSSFQQASYALEKALDYAYSCKDQFEGPSSEPVIVLIRDDRFKRMCHTATELTRLFNN